MRTFEVLYEDGVLKPEQPLPFSPGQRWLAPQTQRDGTLPGWPNLRRMTRNT